MEGRGGRSNAHLEAYFGLHHGYEGKLSEMDAATPAVELLLNEPITTKTHATGQYHLPLEGVPTGEMTIVIPEKVKEKTIWEDKQIADYTQKIRTSVRVPTV